jgi:hypothetical protein
MSKKSSPATVDMDEEWRAKSDADTLVQAEEIRGDSKRHAAAMKCLKGRSSAMKMAMSKPSKKDLLDKMDLGEGE